MSSKLKNNQKQEESLSTAMKQFFAYLLDGMICVFMLLIIVVMPFYHEQGFAYIGTNKAMFFRNVCLNGAKFIIPTLIIYLIFWAVEEAQNRKYMPSKKETGHKKLSGKERIQHIWKICRKHLSVTDMFAILYGVSVILSYLCSNYKSMALWGADGWYMGFLPQMFLLGIYFMISRLWTRREWVFLLFLPASAGVFALGYLNRFGIYPIDMKIQNSNFLSTIGNINWYCGYLVSVFFGGFYLLWTSVGEHKGNINSNRKKVALQYLKKLLLVVYVVIGFGTLVTQGSLSGLVTLAVMLVVAFCMSAKDSKKMLGFWQGTLILSLVCLGTWCLRNVFERPITYIDTYVDLLTNSYMPMLATVISFLAILGVGICYRLKKYPSKLFALAKWVVGGGAIVVVSLVIGMIVMNTLHPGSIGSLSENPFLTFSNNWGSGRGASWKAGWMCFTEQNLLHKLIGVGPDAMEGYLTYHGSSDLVAVVTGQFKTDRLTNTHCEWLTILVNEGLIGLVGFAGMMISAIVRYVKRGKWNVVVGACGFCLLAYTVNNIFSFQQSMNVSTIFVIFGIGEAYARACASFAAMKTMVKTDKIEG